jgi:hypothetical protein
MRVLLLHPEDSLDTGPWANVHWDFIVDLGWSGRYFYNQASQKYSNQMVSLCDLLSPEEHVARLRSLLSVGLGEIVDLEGLDWWELFSPFPYARLDEILMMSAVRGEIGSGDEVSATRSHFLVQVLAMLLGREIKILSAKQGRTSTVLQRYSRLARTFGPAQIAEIALDKWDSDFRLRRLLHRKKKPSDEATILLPSAYVNVSRSQIAYAKVLPQQRFLQVITRRNGRIAGLPENVEVRSLASYAPLPYRRSTEREHRELDRKWRRFEHTTLAGREELNLAKRLGVFAGFPSFLRNGLRVRDAWLGVLTTEPIRSVFSADENNPYTRLPVLLAKSRGITTVFCDHGALNMSFAVRQPRSDVYLVRGEMARDYLLRQSGLPSERVMLGAAPTVDDRASGAGRTRDSIVVFSEAYELFAGRTEGFYREIFPPLVNVARKTARRVVLKLHPFESLPARRRILQRVLSAEDHQSVELLGGPLTPELLERTWCGITVESSVACDCALQGVMCFLCNWFEASWYQYGKQFARFGAGHLLGSPVEISQIPALIERFESTAKVRQQIVSTIGSEELEEILFGRKAARESPR